MTRRVKWILSIAVALLTIDAVFFAAIFARRETSSTVVTSGQQGARSGTPVIGGVFSLLGTDGKEVAERTYHGKWLLIAFGYTKCGRPCRLALTNLSVALQKLGAQGAQLQPLFVTVDAERDRPAVVAEYLRSFNPRIVGLSGNAVQVEAVKRTFRVRMDPNDEETADRSRNEIYLMSPEGSFAAAIDGTTAGSRMAKQLLNLMNDRQICKPGAERLANGLCPATSPMPNAG